MSNVSTLIAFLPIIVFLYRRRFREPRLQFLIILLIVVSIASDAVAYYRTLSHQSTALIFNVQDFIQFGIISLIFYEMCFHEYKTAFFIALSTYVLFAVTNSVLIQPLHEFQNMTWVTSNVIFILFSVTWMLHVLVDSPLWKILRSGEFWVNTAFFVYFSMTVFIFVMTNYMFTNMSTDVSRVFWSLHNLNNIVKNVLFAVAMFYLSKDDESNVFIPS